MLFLFAEIHYLNNEQRKNNHKNIQSATKINMNEIALASEEINIVKQEIETRLNVMK